MPIEHLRKVGPQDHAELVHNLINGSKDYNCIFDPTMHPEFIRKCEYGYIVGTPSDCVSYKVNIQAISARVQEISGNWVFNPHYLHPTEGLTPIRIGDPRLIEATKGPINFEGRKSQHYFTLKEIEKRFGITRDLTKHLIREARKSGPFDFTLLQVIPTQLIRDSYKGHGLPFYYMKLGKPFNSPDTRYRGEQYKMDKIHEDSIIDLIKSEMPKLLKEHYDKYKVKINVYKDGKTEETTKMVAIVSTRVPKTKTYREGFKGGAGI